ncbi:hypothetical protein EF908_34430 [Streptomyces sp. WAC04770]|nr:hypothetical protein EF908_34430 [Streptomyces sp. WAC04770]
MSVRLKSTTQDAALEEAFGAPVGDLYERALEPDAPVSLQRALELRSFLAVAEEHVVRIRDRIHASTATDGAMDDLSAEALHWDAQWMSAALDGRSGCLSALDHLLRSMPPPAAPTVRPVQFNQPRLSAVSPPQAPVQPGTVPARRP